MFTPRNTARKTRLGLALLTTLIGAELSAATLIKADNTTNLNSSGSWVDNPTAPTNTTSSSDTWVWDNTVTAENIVSVGNDLGVFNVQILDPGGPVTILDATNAGRTLSIPSGGSIDMSAATQDLTINVGFVRITSSNGVLNLNVADGHTLTINSTMNVRNSGSGANAIINGPGTVIFNGEYKTSKTTVNSGLVMLNRASGSTRYSNTATDINGGTLLINNTSGSATGSSPVTVNSGGTFGGQGIASGTVTVNGGGALAPGNMAVGSLTVGNLNLEDGAELYMEIVDETNLDQINVTTTSGLSINGGVVHLYQPGTTDPVTTDGIYNIIGYSGALGGSGLASLSVASDSIVSGKTYSFGLTEGYITVRISGAGDPPRNWSVDASGNWSDSANWSNATVPNALRAIASFGSSITSPRTVTVDAPQTVGQLLFDSAQSYTIGGLDILTLDDDGGSAVIAVDNGSHQINAPMALSSAGVLLTVTNAPDTLTLNGAITGPGGIAKAGDGSLVITSDVSFEGALSNGAGLLQLGNGGSSGSVTGALANNGVLKINRSDDALVLGSPISGEGSFVQAGSGTVTMSAANSYKGTTELQQGTLRVTNESALQSSTYVSSSSGGSIVWDESLTSARIGGLAGDKDLILANSVGTPLNATIGLNNESTSYDGSLSGEGGMLTKAGSGTLTLNSGSHTYTGLTTVDAGTLKLNGGAFTGSAINVTTAATSARLVVSGGTLTLSDSSNIGTGSAGFLIEGGEANFNGGLTTDYNKSSGSNLIRVDGGTLNAASIDMGRSSLNNSSEPGSGSNSTGLYVTAGQVNISGMLGIGVNVGANSSVSARIDGGTVNVAGPTIIGINNTSRWSVLDVNAGDFHSTDTEIGVVLGNEYVGNAAFLVRNGSAYVERIQFGQGDQAGSGVLSVTGGTLYVGSGGIVMGTTNSAYSANIKFGYGGLTANADFSTSAPVSLLTDTSVYLQCADTNYNPTNMTFSGPVTGSGGLTKAGSGSLTLASPDNNFSGDVYITDGAFNAGGRVGTLYVTAGSGLSAGGTVGHLSTPSLTLSAPLNVDYNGNGGANQVDRIDVDGDVYLSGVSLNISGVNTLYDDAYVILKSATGGLYGAFDSVTGVPQGYQLKYDYDEGDGIMAIALVSDGTGPKRPAYDQWAVDHNLSGDAAAVTADPDGDGIANLMEYALGLDPNATNASPVAMAQVDGHLTLAFDHIAAADLVFTIEATDDLTGSWSTVQTYPTFTEIGTEVYTDTEAMADHARRFLRLSVSQVTP